MSRWRSPRCDCRRRTARPPSSQPATLSRVLARQSKAPVVWRPGRSSLPPSVKLAAKRIGACLDAGYVIVVSRSSRGCDAEVAGLELALELDRSAGPRQHSLYVRVLGIALAEVADRDGTALHVVVDQFIDRDLRRQVRHVRRPLQADSKVQQIRMVQRRREML